MQRVNALLNWLRPAPKVEDDHLRRLDGIGGHDISTSAPTVKVFAGRPRRSAEAA